MRRDSTDIETDLTTPTSEHIAPFTRRQALVRTGALGAALTLPGILAACGSDSSTGNIAPSSAGGHFTGAEIDHVTWGLKSQAPQSLDIAKAWSLPQLVSAALAFEALLTTAPDLKLKPLIARGYTQPDALHYFFDLRPGVKFWDGSPVTIDDVIYSIERHQDPAVASQIGFFFEAIKSLKAKSSTRLEISLSRPNAMLPQALTLVPILSKKFVEEMGASFASPGSSVKVMGTGPYQITAFTTENGVEVSRNEKYWGAKPKVKAASLKFFETPQTMLLALRSGALDGAFAFELSEAETWSNLSNVDVQFLKETGLTTMYISLDNESEPWSDIHVRRAVAHCCDTAGYVKAFLANQATPATAIVPPAQWANIASKAEQEAIYAQIPQYKFSVDEAKAELEKSAYPDGFSATIPYPNSYPQLGRALVSLSQTLKQIGIKLQVKSVTETEWLSGLLGKNPGAQAVVTGPDFNDPADYAVTIYPSANAGGGGNFANYRNPKVDRLLEEQAAATDDKTRAKLLGEVLKITGEDLPYVPLWWEGPTLAVSEKYVYNGFNPLYYYQAWLDYVGARA